MKKDNTATKLLGLNYLNNLILVYPKLTKIFRNSGDWKVMIMYFLITMLWDLVP